MNRNMVNITEYFCKYGFEDGDNAALSSFARQIRPEVLRRLDREFERRGLPYRTVGFDVGWTSHNWVRASLYIPGKEDWHCDLDHQASPAEFQAVVAVVQASMEKSRSRSR